MKLVQFRQNIDQILILIFGWKFFHKQKNNNKRIHRIRLSSFGCASAKHFFYTNKKYKYKLFCVFLKHILWRFRDLSESRQLTVSHGPQWHLVAKRTYCSSLTAAYPWTAEQLPKNHDLANYLKTKGCWFLSWFYFDNKRNSDFKRKSSIRHNLQQF